MKLREVSKKDLSKLNNDELQNITNRNYKRKQPHDDLLQQFQKFQDDISTLLTNFITEQKDMIVKIGDDMAIHKRTIKRH